MDKISIDTLFPSKSGKRKYNNVNTESLFPNESRLNTSLPYIDSNELIEERKTKEHMIKNIYKKMLTHCINKIKTANSLDFTDIIYEVPIMVYMYPKYNSIDCLEYIEKKLRKSDIDTLILNQNNIFVTWLNVERNKKIKSFS